MLFISPYFCDKLVRSQQNGRADGRLTPSLLFCECSRSCQLNWVRMCPFPCPCTVTSASRDFAALQRQKQTKSQRYFIKGYIIISGHLFVCSTHTFSYTRSWNLWNKQRTPLLPLNRSSPQPSQHALLEPWYQLRQCYPSPRWWANAHAWHHARWSTMKQWANGLWPVWWTGHGPDCSTGFLKWWTVLKDAFRPFQTHVPETNNCSLCYCSKMKVIVQASGASHGVPTWNGWDRRSAGSSLRLLHATTAVLPKSMKKTCKTHIDTIASFLQLYAVSQLSSICTTNLCYRFGFNSVNIRHVRHFIFINTFTSTVLPRKCTILAR